MLYIPFWIPIVSATMAASGTNVQPITTDQSAPFEIHRIIGSTDDANELTDFSPNYFTVKVTNKSTSRLWTQDAIPQRAFTPKGSEQYLRRPVMLQPNTNLSFEFTNISSGNLVATIVLEGYLVFPG